MLRTQSGLISNSSEICAIFTDEFKKNFSPSSDSSTCCGLSSVANLASINVDVTIVRVALVQLRESASGSDDLLAVFFKQLVTWLVVPLTIIY